MGLSGISAVQLGIVLLIVILIFGTKRIRQLGQDLGGGLRGIRDGMKELEDTSEELNKQMNEQNAQEQDDVYN